MKFETLQAICAGEKTELKRDGDTFVIEDFIIFETEEPVMINTVAGTRDSGRKMWQVDQVQYESGSRWEPETSDVVEVHKTTCLDNAVQYVLEHLAKRSIGFAFESAFEMEHIEEMENAYS